MKGVALKKRKLRKFQSKKKMYFIKNIYFQTFIVKLFFFMQCLICLECLEGFDCDDDENTHKNPDCGHEFCKTCWNK